MKHFATALIVAALTTATSAFAQGSAQTIATYTEGVARDNGRLVVANIQLRDDGSLAIGRNIAGNPSETLPEIVSTLSPETVSLLKSKVEALANAEIVTTKTQIVCMMMPLFGVNNTLSVARGYDYQTGLYKDAAEIVDNNAGCWLNIHISPKQPYDVTTAKTLEAQLQVLANEAIAAAR